MSECKTCTACGVSQERTNFYKSRTRKSGIQRCCKTCSKAKHKKWRQKNPLQDTKRKTAWQNEWRKHNPLGILLIQAKARSRQKNVPCSITVDDLYIPEKCPYLGLPLVRATGKATDASPSIDEIVPGIGYVPGNVQVISTKANSMKRNATPEDLLRFARRVMEQFQTT